jgi:hypothetical protein
MVEVPTGLLKAERETVIRWDEEDRLVTIWSASPMILRRLARLGVPCCSESRQQNDRLHDREFRVPLAQFRFGLKRKSPTPSGRHFFGRFDRGRRELEA